MTCVRRWSLSRTLRRAARNIVARQRGIFRASYSSLARFKKSTCHWPNLRMNGTRQPVAQHLRGKCSATGRAPVMLVVRPATRLPACWGQDDSIAIFSSARRSEDPMFKTSQFRRPQDFQLVISAVRVGVALLSCSLADIVARPNPILRPQVCSTSLVRRPTTSITGARPVALHLPRKCCATG